jgi:hypothetical protein
MQRIVMTTPSFQTRLVGLVAVLIAAVSLLVAPAHADRPDMACPSEATPTCCADMDGAEMPEAASASENLPAGPSGHCADTDCPVMTACAVTGRIGHRRPVAAVSSDPARGPS